MLRAKVTTKKIDGKVSTIGYIDLIITKAELEKLVFDKLREERPSEMHTVIDISGSDLPETKSLEEVNGLILQVSRVVHKWKWMDNSSACCINYEDRINFYNEYWQEIVDIVKQSLTKGKE